MRTSTVKPEPSIWLWLFLPLAIAPLVYGVKIFDADLYAKIFKGELGLIELATPVLLVPAVISGYQCFQNRRLLPEPWLRSWLLIVTLACIYFAGEEISWGQHLPGRETAEAIQGVNGHQETNLHNRSSWFNQKPRLLLELWILIGGIILPIWRRLSNINYLDSDWQYWFWPTSACFPAALVAILIRLPERIRDMFGLSPYSIEIRYSEVQELCFAIFLMLYLLSCSQRLRED